MITALTDAQRSRIEAFQHKWWAIAHSHQSLDEAATCQVIEQMYALAELPAPKVVFAGSPFEGAALMTKHLQTEVNRKPLIDPGWNRCRNQLWSELLLQLSPPVNKELWSAFQSLSSQGSWSWLIGELSRQIRAEASSSVFEAHDIVRLEEMTAWVAQLDFCREVLGCQINPALWDLLSQSVHHCYWLLATETFCVACDRPLVEHRDDRGLPHAEGEPAIAFANGDILYVHHGVPLPESYGKVRPEQWRSHWILEETNAELRRVLIGAIGYARLCQELETTELDSWKEYTLLRLESFQQRIPEQVIYPRFPNLEGLEEFLTQGFQVEKDNDGFQRLVRPASSEPIHLLKMTCPSTGHIHAMRVPPTLQTAREAVGWMNWDIDAEEFTQQT